MSRNEVSPSVIGTSQDRRELEARLLPELAGDAREHVLTRGIVIPARWSAHGRDAPRMVASDAVGACEELRKAGIADLADLLPSEAELAVLAASAKNVGPDGSRVLVKRHELLGGLVTILLCMASTTSMADDLEQPFSIWFAQYLGRREPALVFAKCDDRFGRHPLGRAMVAAALVAVEDRQGLALIGSGDEPIRRPSIPREAEHGQQKGINAKRFHSETLRVISRKTAGSLEGGSMPYSHPSPVPYGSMTARIKSRHHRFGQAVLYVDAAWARPEAGTVLGDLVLVQGRGKDPVDQPALVSRALEMYADQAPMHVIGRDLVVRGLTSSALARDKGEVPVSSFRDRYGNDVPMAAAISITRSIIENLDVWRTGRFVRHWNGEDLAITDFWPAPVQPWATYDVLEAVGDRARSRPVISSGLTTSFGGITVLVDGAPGVLVAQSYTCGQGVRGDDVDA